MPCSLSVLLSIQRSPLSDSLLVAYLCSPISFLFNLSASLRSSRGHFHYGMSCAFPPSVCICVIYNADQEGGMWKIIREARAVPRLGASSPGQSKQLLGGQWATGMGGQLWPCCDSPASFSWSTASASQAGCISCQRPMAAEGGLGCGTGWWWWVRIYSNRQRNLGDRLAFQPSPHPFHVCGKKSSFPMGLFLVSGAAIVSFGWSQHVKPWDSFLGHGCE